MTSTGDRVEAFVAAIDSYHPTRLEAHEDAFRVFSRFVSRRIDARYLERHPVEELLPDLEDLMAAGFNRGPDEIKVTVNLEPGGDGRHGTLITCMPDQPFVFSTVRLALESLGITAYRWLNPIVPSRRDTMGELAMVGQSDGIPESFIWIEIEAEDLEGRAKEIEDHVRGRLEAAKIAVEDFNEIHTCIQVLAERCDALARERTNDRVAFEDNASLLRWLLAENFVFLGIKYLTDEDDHEEVPPLRDLGVGKIDDWRGMPIEDAERAVLDAGAIPPFLWVRKSKNESWTYRPGRTDHILVQCYREDGRPAGLLVIEGLFSYQALAKPRTDIPLLERIIDRLYAQFQASRGSHRFRTIRNAFNSLPLEYLFALQAEDVHGIVEQVLDVDSENRLQVHITSDELQNFAFVFLTLPRAHYSDELRSDVRKLLRTRFRASAVDDGVYHGNVDSVAVHYFLTGAVSLDTEAENELRHKIEEMATLWADRLLAELKKRHANDDARRLHQMYSEAFTTRYREETSIARATTDIELLEKLADGATFDCDIYREKLDTPLGVTRLRLYESENMLLSDILPVLDNFGLVVMDEFPTTVHVPGAAERVVATFRIRGVEGMDFDILTRRNRLRAGIRAVVGGAMANAPLNRLLLRADIPWTYVVLVRAYQSYAQLTGSTYTQSAILDALQRHADVLRGLTELFRAKFDPTIEGTTPSVDDEKRRALVDRTRRSVVTLIDGISDMISDQIMRTFYDLVEATVRTNFYARDPMKVPELVLKFDPSKITRLPSPRPYREIYVHHPKIRGLHLRGGPVARGGIRWSDRTVDFRTEVLGLMATQNLKNVLIVPRGAKGAFVLQDPPSDLARRRATADEMYKIFIGGLLQVTDNRIEGEIRTPENVVRYDDLDEYLVVAADKGTAHLSDTANDVAATHDFWLGDAFASGGSKGYDHKKCAITAKGAWECVKRHFGEMGMHPERDKITIAGIGDMSGDVFGNGLLLSRSAQLVAAFDHRDIFLDPDPDPEQSYAIRKKLFDTPRSSWKDYPVGDISEGGGVYPRGAKSIKLSPQVQTMLGVKEESLSGQDLVKAILQMPVDLLWNGGIGTYIKASHETHLDVGDPPNDHVRVDAPTVRARVIGEGGNLGITPSGRIELASAGVRLNTDAVDNSAGVDMSDHEVNLKILFEAPVKRGEMPLEERDALMLELTDEVSRTVLLNNWVQSRMISLDLLRTKRDIARFKRAIFFLGERVPFRRREMFLPGERLILQRAKNNEGLFRPELAVLCANAKLDLRQELVKIDSFDLDRLESYLINYFPSKVVEKFRKDVREHPLGINIARTMLTNEIIGDTGCAWLAEMTQRTGRNTEEILNAYLNATELMGATEIKAELSAAEDKVDSEVEYRLRLLVEDAIEGVTTWLLRQTRDLSSNFGKVFNETLKRLPELSESDDAERLADSSVVLRMAGLTRSMAESLVVFERIEDVVDASVIASSSGQSLERSVKALNLIGADTSLSSLIRTAGQGGGDEDMDRPARFAVRDRLREHLVELALAVLETEDDLGKLSADTVRRLEYVHHDIAPLLGDSTVPLSNLVVAGDRVARHVGAWTKNGD